MSPTPLCNSKVWRLLVDNVTCSSANRSEEELTLQIGWSQNPWNGAREPLASDPTTKTAFLFVVSKSQRNSSLFWIWRGEIKARPLLLSLEHSGLYWAWLSQAYADRITAWYAVALKSLLGSDGGIVMETLLQFQGMKFSSSFVTFFHKEFYGQLSSQNSPSMQAACWIKTMGLVSTVYRYQFSTELSNFLPILVLTHYILNDWSHIIESLLGSLLLVAFYHLLYL
jgi:hypothetical protein